MKIAVLSTLCFTLLVAFAEANLKQDFEELAALVPVEEVRNLTVHYVRNDRGVRRVFDYVRHSKLAKRARADVARDPDVQALGRWVRDRLQDNDAPTEEPQEQPESESQESQESHERPPHERPPHERPPHERPPHERPPHERPPHERPPQEPEQQPEEPQDPSDVVDVLPSFSGLFVFDAPQQLARSRPHEGLGGWPAYARDLLQLLPLQELSELVQQKIEEGGDYSELYHLVKSHRHTYERLLRLPSVRAHRRVLRLLKVDVDAVDRAVRQFYGWLDEPSSTPEPPTEAPSTPEEGSTTASTEVPTALE